MASICIDLNSPIKGMIKEVNYGFFIGIISVFILTNDVSRIFPDQNRVEKFFFVDDEFDFLRMGRTGLCVFGT